MPTGTLHHRESPEDIDLDEVCEQREIIICESECVLDIGDFVCVI